MTLSSSTICKKEFQLGMCMHTIHGLAWLMYGKIWVKLGHSQSVEGSQERHVLTLSALQDDRNILSPIVFWAKACAVACSAVAAAQGHCRMGRE